MESPGGGAQYREAPLPLLLSPQFLLPIEARETEEGTEVAVGAHQDVVVLQGMGRTHNMEGGGPPTSRGGANGNFSSGTRLALLIHKIAILRSFFLTDTRTFIYTVGTAIFRNYINNYILYLLLYTYSLIYSNSLLSINKVGGLLFYNVGCG